MENGKLSSDAIPLAFLGDFLFKRFPLSVLHENICQNGKSLRNSLILQFAFVCPRFLVERFK